MKEIIKVFKALSDPTRLRIVRLLLERDLCVCELMYILNMEQSRISHQLRILRDADLVEDTRDGKWIIYRIPDSLRKTLMPLINLYLKEKIGGSQEILSDIKSLRLCLKEDVRKTRGNRNRD
jgi:ArsR family transcriptional regulator